MTVQKSFKRLVRARMAKTGESYTTARVQLLATVVRRSSDADIPAVRLLRRADPGAHRPRLGGVVRPARFLGRRSMGHTELARRVAELLASIRWCGMPRP